MLEISEIAGDFFALFSSCICTVVVIVFVCVPKFLLDFCLLVSTGLFLKARYGMTLISIL